MIDLKFIQLYRNSLIEKGNESQLVQLISSCAFFKNITYQNLTGVSEEEYNKNCNDVINYHFVIFNLFKLIE